MGALDAGLDPASQALLEAARAKQARMQANLSVADSGVPVRSTTQPGGGYGQRDLAKDIVARRSASMPAVPNTEGGMDPNATPSPGGFGGIVSDLVDKVRGLYDTPGQIVSTVDTSHVGPQRNLNPGRGSTAGGIPVTPPPKNADARGAPPVPSAPATVGQPDATTGGFTPIKTTQQESPIRHRHRHPPRRRAHDGRRRARRLLRRGSEEVG